MKLLRYYCGTIPLFYTVKLFYHSRMSDVRMHPSWKAVLEAEFSKPYWQELTAFARQEYKSGVVYPPAASVFRAFDLCPFEKVRVVIVGQDPYHGANQANGLSFAVSDGTPLPPSLKNIYKEIHADLGIVPHQSGDLSRWAEQGVLLLNSVLTVSAGKPASHKGKGWEQFTDAVIHALATHRSQLVYLLWGKYAQAKGSVVNSTANLMLTSGHPSPYSAHLFLGNHHFSQCNNYLRSQGQAEVNWR